MSASQKSEAERYKGAAKWCQYLIARGFVVCLQRLPIGFAFRFGRGVGWLLWKVLKKRRVVVANNLAVINEWLAGPTASNVADGSVGRSLQAAGEPLEDVVACRFSKRSTLQVFQSMEPDAQVLEVFQRAGANLLAGFRLAKLKLEAMDRRVELLGIEHLQAAHSQGLGVIVVLAHMGPWEALNHMPHFMSKHGLEAPLASLYRPLNNAYLDKWIYQQRAAMGTQLFSRRTGFHQPVDFLRAGGLLGILSDQKMREGPRAPYFGVEVPSSPIAGLMHRRSGAPMVALSVATVGLAQWRLEFRPVAVPETTDLSSREQMAAITNHALEKSLLQSPLDGFWLHKRF